MPDWKRSTREIPFESVDPEVRVEVQKHVELYNPGDILSNLVISIQTDSEKAKKGLFGSAEINHTTAILTPRWLLWVVSGTKTKAAILSAQLRDVVIEDYANTPFAKQVSDSGIQVSGWFTDMSENVSAFIGLEDNTSGIEEIKKRQASERKPVF